MLEEKVHLFDRLKEMEEKVYTSTYLHKHIQHKSTHTMSHQHQVSNLEKELQWVMVMELERNIAPLEDQLQKENSRIPRNQQNVTKAQVGVYIYKCMYMYTVHNPKDAWLFRGFFCINPK